MLSPVGGRVDDDVRLFGAERAIGLIGKARSAVSQPRLQDDIAGLENLVIRHGAARSLLGGGRPSTRSRLGSAARDERTQRFCLVFDLVETVFDHIADA